MKSQTKDKFNNFIFLFQNKSSRRFERKFAKLKKNVFFFLLLQISIFCFAIERDENVENDGQIVLFDQVKRFH